MMASIEDPTVDHRKLAFARNYARTEVKAKTLTTTTMSTEATMSASSSSSKVQMSCEASPPSEKSKESMVMNQLKDNVQLKSLNGLLRSDETLKRVVRISAFPSFHLVRSVATGDVVSNPLFHFSLLLRHCDFKPVWYYFRLFFKPTSLPFTFLQFYLPFHLFSIMPTWNNSQFFYSSISWTIINQIFWFIVYMKFCLLILKNFDFKKWFYERYIFHLYNKNHFI